MVLLFLPAMAAFAACLLWAPFMILRNEGTWLPVITDLVCIVVENIWLPSEVLPIVRIDALCFVVLLVEGAPFGFEIKHVKVGVLGHLVYQPRLELLGAMGEGAIVAVFALRQILGILGAIL